MEDEKKKDEEQVIYRKVGNTIYEVHVNFKKGKGEGFTEKLKRVRQNRDLSKK